jgi:hypothetical protein
MRTLKCQTDEEYQKQKKMAENENLKEITLQSFAEKVKKMRHLQKRYFATRNQSILAESKKMEVQVDKDLESIFNVQQYLF